MNLPPRVVLDTSTLISAALHPGSIPALAVYGAIQFCEIYASLETLRELEDVLNRSKLDRYLNRERRCEFLDLIRQGCIVTAVGTLESSTATGNCRDPRDDKFLAVCLSAKVDFLVSGDKDLLALNSWAGIAIIAPREFLAVLENGESKARSPVGLE